MVVGRSWSRPKLRFRAKFAEQGPAALLAEHEQARAGPPALLADAEHEQARAGPAALLGGPPAAGRARARVLGLLVRGAAPSVAHPR